MRGVCFHFLELLTVLHNLCLDCSNRLHFWDKFSPKKNVYIRKHTNYSISGYYVYRDVSTSSPRRAPQGRRPLHFAYRDTEVYRNVNVYRDVSTSSPRRAPQGRRPLHFAYRDTEDYRDVNVYRDVGDAVPYISLIGIPKFIGTSTFIGTSAPHYLGVLRKDAVPHNFVALTEQIPYSGIITFRFISLSDI